MDDVSIFICTKITTNENLDILKVCIEYATKIYPDNPIYIIDDNSSIPILTSMFINNNITIISNDEYPGAGEITRLYYFWKFHPTKYAICIHDSTFLNKKLTMPKSYEFLYCAKHIYNRPNAEMYLIKELNNEKLNNFYLNNKNKWTPGFGVQVVISYDFLNKVLNTFPNFFTSILPKIKLREDRMDTERFVPCVFNFIEHNKKFYYGDIHEYTKKYSNGRFSWGVSYKDFIDNIDLWNKAPIIKIWVGR